MKKIILILSVLFIGIMASAQSVPANYTKTTPNYVAETPWGNFGSFYYQLGQGYDSVHVVTGNVTVPSDYMIMNIELVKSTNANYVDTFIMPTTPIYGQTVNIYWSQSQIAHKFNTKPAFIRVDSSGVNRSQLIWNGTFWKMVQ